MRFRHRFRQSLKQTVRANVLRQEAQIIAAGRPVPKHIAEAAATERAAMERESARQPRAAAGADGRPLERDVQASIIQALRLHPRVAKVIRFNSGAVQGETSTGKRIFVRFSSEPVPDVYFYGATVWGWIEVKRPGWTKPIDAREERQAAFLSSVRDCGGVGLFATSVDQVMAAL